MFIWKSRTQFFTLDVMVNDGESLSAGETPWNARNLNPHSQTAQLKQTEDERPVPYSSKNLGSTHESTIDKKYEYTYFRRTFSNRSNMFDLSLHRLSKNFLVSIWPLWTQTVARASFWALRAVAIYHIRLKRILNLNLVKSHFPQSVAQMLVLTICTEHGSGTVAICTNFRNYLTT